MKKKHIIAIKEIIKYDDYNAEHKRLLRRLKKEYMKLPSKQKVNLIKDLRRTFEVDDI